MYSGILLTGQLSAIMVIKVCVSRKERKKKEQAKYKDL